MAIIHCLVVFMCVIFPTGYVLGLDCGDNVLGMQNNVIPADKITASSGTAGDRARLNYTKLDPSWCDMGNDDNPYLQIDLGTPHIICAVATQGDRQGRNWVKAFHLNFSDDGVNYSSYSINDNTIHKFYGNVDGSGIVKQILCQGIIARYLRILPMMHYGAVCLRTEIYGVQIRSENLAFNKTCRTSNKLQDASKVVDGSLEGSTSSISCLTLGSDRYKEWWGVNLGTSFQVFEVSVLTYSIANDKHTSWSTPFNIIIGFSAWKPIHSSNQYCGGESNRYVTLEGRLITFVCEPPKTGKFVYIRLLQEKVKLTLCEVEVYGRENFAYGKPANQSSTWYQHNAGNAVDGNYGNKAVTTFSGGRKWWMLNLGQRLRILEVKAFVYRSQKKYMIFVGDNTSNGGTHNLRCNNTHVRIIGHQNVVYCRSPIVGQYLTILITDDKRQLQLREIEVYTQNRAVICSENKIAWTKSPWTPSTKETNIISNLGMTYYICAVATKASSLTFYHLWWRTERTNWTFQTLTGNGNRLGFIKHVFPRPLQASVIVFQPLKHNEAKNVSIEVFGAAKNESAAPIPPQIGKVPLHPSLGSHVDLVCRADKGLKIKWYYNDTDITSYSSSIVRTGPVLTSTLRVNYTSADDIYDKYTCGEIVVQKRNCTSLEYICQVDYGSYRKQQSRGKVTIALGVPNQPIVVKEQAFSHSALIVILQPNQTDDQGNITQYFIEIKGSKPSLHKHDTKHSSKLYTYSIRVAKQVSNTKYSAEREGTKTSLGKYTLTDLKPYTNYRVRVMASSRIGKSEWSAPVTFTTLQAEPSASPRNVNARKIKEDTFNISWDKIPDEHANGNIVAYEVNWKRLKMRRQRRSPSPSSQARNATETSHYLLDGLLPNVAYDVSIRGYTQAGPGPSSTPITINDGTKTEKGTGSNDRSSLTSSSSSKSFLLIIIISAVVSALIIIMIIMIIIIVVRKRHKKRKNKERQRVKYTAQNSEPDAERSLIEENKERDEKEKEDQNVETCGNLLSSEATKGSVPVGQFVEYMRKAGEDENELLTIEFESIENGERFPALAARKATNKIKNRYGNIVPYDHSRVVLENVVDDDEHSDYINASYIRGFDGRHISYIASQGPVTQTVVDFWHMIWQEKTSVIVMLTGLIEGNKIKCEQYWPDDCDTYLDISVQLQKTEVFADYSIRSFYLTMTKTNEQRCVFQYHFTAWPDKGVPQYATQLLAFRRRLASDTAMACPWVVHCSAGVGRTGAFLAVDAMLRQAQEKKTIDVFNFVKTMRENRPYMVQTSEQYIFVHTAILEFLTCGITEIRAQQLREEMNKLAKVDENKHLSGYEMEFKHLSKVSPEVHDDEIEVANKPCNSGKNRFPDNLPLDKARVFLESDVDEEGANYINASYANGYRQRFAYILTQAPLDNTIADFWKMIYDNKLGTIVMLNKLQEGDVSYPQYWPQEGSDEFGDITLEKTQEEENNSVTSRTFTLTHQKDGPGGAHIVRHFQNTDWADHSVPSNVQSILDLIERLERSQQQSGNKSIVVQCSDGVGRSGTLCTILSLLDRVKTEQMVDVFQTVKALRISRPGAVETAVQYQFCFESVMSFLDSFSDYSNFND